MILYISITISSWFYEDTTCSKRIAYGDLLKVRYKGYLPNGKVFYDNTESKNGYDEFTAGIPGQTIEGMNTAFFLYCAKVKKPKY